MSQSIAAAIINIAIVVFLIWIWWIVFIYRSRLTYLAQRLVKKWSGHTIFLLWEKVREFFVYFLDSRGEVQFLPVNQFLKLRLPETERPKVWFCCLELSDKRQEIYLGWPDDRKWHLSSFVSVDGWMELVDQNGKKIPIGEAKNHTDRIQTVLQIASNYGSVDEYALKLIADYAIPVLEKTKETMGKSPALANIRAALALGTGIFRSRETVDFETLSYLVP